MMKPMLIKASGNDPFIVMPSASVDIAARVATFAAFMNCGQICTSAERFYVHEKVHDRFVNKLVQSLKAWEEEPADNILPAIVRHCRTCVACKCHPSMASILMDYSAAHSEKLSPPKPRRGSWPN